MPSSYAIDFPALSLTTAREFTPTSGNLKNCHVHDSAQLHYLSSGSARFICGQRQWHLAPGRWCWIAPGMPHQLLSTSTMTGMVFHFAAEPASRLKLTAGVYQSNELLRQLLVRALQYLERGQADALHRLCLVLSDELCAARSDPWTLTMPQHSALAELAQQIVARPHLQFNLADVAKRSGFSERSFSRHFQSQTGMSFGVWLRHARMFCAAQLLAEGLPIKLVAAQVGYQSVSSFTQSFAEISGETPALWQQNLRHN